MNADSTILYIYKTVGSETTTWQIPVGAGGSGGTQLQSSWSDNDPTSPAYIIDKPTNVSAFTNDAGYLTSESDPTVNNATITIQKNGSPVDNFTLNQSGDKTINITVPTNTNELTNGAGFLTAETDPTVNNATITIQKNGTEVDHFTANQSSDKNINILVPTKTSDLTNDNGFITSYTETDPTVNNATITIQKNGTEVDHFTANQSSDKTINITVPTQTSELTNNSGFITAADVPAQVNADWNATSGAAQIMNKPDISEVQIQNISNDTIYFTNGTYAVMKAQWSNVLNKPTFSMVATTNDYNDLSNLPDTISHFTNDMGYITAADIPAQQQADWNEEDHTSPAYIHNKPNLNDYAKLDTLNNFVTKTEDETVGGDKTFTGYTNFNDYVDFNESVDFYEPVYFNEYVEFWDSAYFEEFTGFYDDVLVSNYTGRISVPSVLDNIETDGTLVVEDNFGESNCHNAVNFCDLQTVYDDIQAKMQTKLNELTDAFNDQVDDLLDSIAKLNDQLKTPKDGEACPNTPTVTDQNGNVYSTVRIGNQCWMRENMRCTTCNNGRSLGYGSTGPNYSTTDSLYIYPKLSSSTQNAIENGRLYNYKAASAICPRGWRLPSSTDWEELRNYVKVQDKYKGATNHSYYTKSLASTFAWTNSTYADETGNLQETNNATGFTAIPAGHYPTTSGVITPTAGNYGNVAAFWSSDKNTFGIRYYYGMAYIGNSTSDIGTTKPAESAYMSVRCIRKNSNGEANTVPLPTVETYAPSQAITDLSTTSATLKAGRIVSDGDMAPLTGIQEAGYVRSNTAGSFTDATLRLGKSHTTKGAVVNSISSYPYVLNSVSLTNLTSNTRYYYRVYAISIHNDTVYGAVKYFTTESNEKACPELENFTDIASNSYPTVKIGTQCWMAGNLRTTNYADNTGISGYFNPNGGSSANANYGRLYTYDAAVRGTYYHTGSGNVQGACPSGWHVPSPAEFETMKTTMQGTTAYQCNSTAANIAKALASKSGWTTSSDACAVGNVLSDNNASGFNAYPAGYIGKTGSNPNAYGTEARFYTTDLGSLYRLHNNLATLTTFTPYNPEDWAYSLRCVQGDNYVPVVKTGGSSSVSVKTVTLSGSVPNAGSSSVTQRGICYATSNNPTTANSTKTATGTTGDFTVDLSNLSPNTTYYYRTFATNSYGTAYGQVKSFTTLTGKTIANYSGFSQELTQTSVRVGGKITDGAATETVNEWGFLLYKKQSNGSFSQVLDAYSDNLTQYTSGSYTYKLNSTPQSGTFSMTIGGLDPGTTYKYEAQMHTDLQNWVYANSQSAEFTTLMNPTVTTVSATYPGSGTSIVMKGNVTNVGIPAYTEKGFLIATSTNPTYDNNYAKHAVSGTSAGEFTYTWSGWTTPNKTWYIRAYVKNSSGVFYGTTITYTTPDKPSLDGYNGFATYYFAPYYYSANVTKTSIKTGTYFATGGSPITSSGLLYTTNSSLASNAPTSSTVSTNASDAGTKWVQVPAATPGTYSYPTITGLSSNTIYYLRTYATNAYGTTYSSSYQKVRTALDCGQNLYDQENYQYNTVKIGSQCWMKQNLVAKKYDNVPTYGSGSGTSIEFKVGSSYTSLTTPYGYYPNNSQSNTNAYGNLYNWAAATGYGVNNNPSGTNMVTSQGKVQGICPRGWHIPTQTEFTTLKNNLDQTVNMSAFNWNQLAGWLDYDGGSASYDEFGQYLELRGSTVDASNTNATAGLYIRTGPSAYNNNYFIDKRSGTSVRCVQDIAY